MREGLPEECHITCVCAASKFEEMCKRLEKGDINLQDLRKMKQHEHQVKTLCEAVAASSQKTVVHDLNQRLKEFTHFSTRQRAYLEVCKWIMDSGNPTNPVAGAYSIYNCMQI